MPALSRTEMWESSHNPKPLCNATYPGPVFRGFYARAHTPKHTYTYTYLHTYAHTHAYTLIRIHTYTHADIHTRTHR